MGLVCIQIPFLLFIIVHGWYPHDRNAQRFIQPSDSARVAGKASCACSSEATKESIFAMKKNLWRAVIEVAFIVFLFYSNLLMGEFERSGMGYKKGLVWAIGDIFTAANFEIAMIAGLIGYILFEYLRKKF